MAGNRAVSHQELSRRVYHDGIEKTCTHLREALEQKHIAPSDFSIRELAVTLVEDGAEWVQSMNPLKSGTHLLEAGAVTTANFSNIVGQINYTAILDAFTDEEYVFSGLIPEQQTPFNGEKIAGMAKIGDEAEVVNEGDPYLLAGVSEDYIESPETLKRGFEVDVTKEAIFFDRTGLILQRCSEVGKNLGLNKEKRAIDCLIDENTTKHRYKWRGTSYASYQTSTPWDNTTATATLVDWTDLDEAEQTLASILDPFTGEPIVNTHTDLVVTRQNLWIARRIVNATEITVVTPGYGTTGNPTETKASNPVTKVNIHSSQLLAARMATETTWYLGTISKYAKYMYNWPLQVLQSDMNSEVGFTRDIVARYRADERGAYVVVQPRVVTKCTVA